MAHKDPQELYEEFFIKERNICLELIRKYEISSKTFKECAIPDTVKRLHEMDVTLSKMDEQITRLQAIIDVGLYTGIVTASFYSKEFVGVFVPVLNHARRGKEDGNKGQWKYFNWRMYEAYAQK